MRQSPSINRLDSTESLPTAPIQSLRGLHGVNSVRRKCQTLRGASPISKVVKKTAISVSGPDPKALVPRQWRAEIQGVLITEAQIARRVRQLSSEIEADFGGRDIVIVALLNGTVLF